MTELIEQFYKEHGTTNFPKKFERNGKCHIGNRKNCPYYDVKDDREVCNKGWCLCK